MKKTVLKLQVTAMSLVACSLFFSAFAARTFSISEQTDTSVTFRFETPDGLDYSIYLASGATDADDDKYGWDAFAKIGDVRRDDTSLTYEVPAELRDGRPLRFFLMQDANLAMSKELDKVSSDGRQFVCLDFVPTTRTLIDCRFGEVTSAAAFFGQTYYGSRQLLCVQSGAFKFYGSGASLSVNSAANTDYRCVVDEDSLVHFFYNGVEKCVNASDNKNSTRGVLAGKPLGVFGCGDGTYLSAFSLYRMILGTGGAGNGKPERDLIPALDLEGVPGLYDQINDRFFVCTNGTPLIAGNPRPASRFGRVVDTTPTFSFRRSVAVAATTAETVTLAFANPDGAAYTLFVASGTQDCGARKLAWDAFTEIADIAADATSYTYTLPASLKVPGTFYRFFLVQKNNLPYLKELVSMSSAVTSDSSAQTVRLDYIPDMRTAIDFRFGNCGNLNNGTLFGQGYYGYNCLFSTQGSMFKFFSAGQSLADYSNGASLRFVLSQDNMARLDQGGEVGASMAVSRLCAPIQDLCVFGTYGMLHGLSFRFDSMTVWDDGLVVRDLVPVNTSKGGALYDRIRNRVHYNVGNSATFSLGTPVARPGRVVNTSPTFGSEVLPRFVQLTEDADWTGLTAKIPEEITVDLNGHTLKIVQDGAKHFTFTGTPGTLDLTMNVDRDLANFTFSTYPREIIKRGTGTLTINQSLQNVPSIVVEAGFVKPGAEAMVRSATTVTIKNGAGFDFNKQANNDVFFVAEGTGPDGKGAIRNLGSFSVSTVQMSGITLTGDTTIYSPNGHLGLIRSGNGPTTFELNGHALRCDYVPANAGFWFCNTTGATEGSVYFNGGIPYFYHKSYEVNLPNVDFVVDGSSAIFRIPGSDFSKTVRVRDVTLQNGAKFEEGNNVTHLRNLTLLDGAKVTGIAAWIYASGLVTVSNETTNLEIVPPINKDGTAPKLVKYGAGTFTIKNNHTEQRMDGGAELFGGTVVMSSTAKTPNYHYAISSQPVPVTIHAGATLDMTQCTQPVKLSALQIDAGGTLRHNPSQAIAFPNGATFTRPLPFAFSGTVDFGGTVTFDLTEFFAGSEAPAVGTMVTLLEAGAITGAAELVVKGCPCAYDVFTDGTAIKLRTKSAAQVELAPIKIHVLGGNFAWQNEGTGANWRGPLAQLLTQEGWNVKMTGWRRSTANSLAGGMATAEQRAAWGNCAAVKDLAIKTSPTRAGVLEGLETYCAAAEHPDFTIFVCGDMDVIDAVPDATVLANFKEAVTRIKAALPMTTVIASTIVGGSSALNADIAAWCATQNDVACVDLASSFGVAGMNGVTCAAAAQAVKAKLLELATANGKLMPSTWTPPAVVLGAENNVPAAYRNGFTHVRTLEPAANQFFGNNVDAVLYSYSPLMRKTGIKKVGYYIELVRADTGDLQALWVDMDAPGSTWADVSVPVVKAQTKSCAVTKLHVWSNFGGVRQVSATDDSVDGCLEFCSGNYSQGEHADCPIAEPWANGMGFNDGLVTDADAGHGCFQLIRRFADGSFPGAEILFAWNGMGYDKAQLNAIGMGTLANYGNHPWTSKKELDWTWAYDTGSEALNASAYSTRRIEFWVQYEGEAPTRAELVDAVWTGAADNDFWKLDNWTTAENAAPTSADNTIWQLPAGTDLAPAYSHVDGVAHATTTVVVDGTLRLVDVGGYYNNGLILGATGRVVIDPTKFVWRFRTAPIFEPGAKIALSPNFAGNTNGRFLITYWEQGTVDPASLENLFDAASASGTNPKFVVETLENGSGRLWLDLASETAKQRLNVLTVGDSITQGYYSTYGNWRIPLMKKICAAGYEAWSKGFWTIESQDITGGLSPDEWLHHAGISAQRTITKNGAGTLDAIEAMLDQAGDLDFVLVKLGTNDLNADGTSPEALYPAWTNLVWKILNHKPHAKVICGAVVDQAFDAAKDAKVQAFNTLTRTAIEGGAFPAKRVYFSDLYTPCYRYDANRNYIPGSFYDASNLHPDWPGEDKLSDAYLATMLTALAEAEDGWQPGASEVVPTTTGAENNVPPEYLVGFTCARVLDVVANQGTSFPQLGSVPYEDATGCTAATANLSRVGYYIELRRKNDSQSDFHNLTRWMWVSMDAFGDRTLETVGVPLNTVSQCLTSRLRVASNMPGIEPIAADREDVNGWIEFWKNSYGDGTGPSGPGIPAHLWGCDWNEAMAANGLYGSMQVHRVTPGGSAPAQVLFAFNRWGYGRNFEIGFGPFANIGLGSLDWTFTGDANKHCAETMSILAYDIARIEIWTASMADDPGAKGVEAQITAIVTEGDATTVDVDVDGLGLDATRATLTLDWSTDANFATVAGSANLGSVEAAGRVTGVVSNLAANAQWYFRVTAVNDCERETKITSDPYEIAINVWRPSAADATWSSLAWLKNGAGDARAFTSGWATLFDGAETAKPATINVDADVATSLLTVGGDGDYTFVGTGRITAGKVEKTGTGTLTVDGAGFAGRGDIVVKEGTLKVGGVAGEHALGAAGGTVRVEGRGVLDLNASDSDALHNNIYHSKQLVLANGGTIVNNGPASTAGGPGHLRIEGEGTLAGAKRFDVRNIGGDPDCTTTVIDGDEEATLNINNSAEMVCINNPQPMTIKKMNIKNPGRVRFEGGGTHNIADGIHFETGGRLGIWNSTVSAGAGVNVGAGVTGEIFTEYGTGYVAGPVTVEGTLRASAGTTHFQGAITNRGEIAATGGETFFDGSVTVVNEGNPLNAVSSTQRFYAGKIEGDMRMAVSGGAYCWMGGGDQDWGDSTLDVSLTGGGSFVFGRNDDYKGFPKFGKDKLHVTVANGHTGTFFLFSGGSGRFDGLDITGPLGTFAAQGPNQSDGTRAIPEVRVENLKVTASKFSVGNNNGRNELTLTGENTDVTATSLAVDEQYNRETWGTLRVMDGSFAIGTGGLTTSWLLPDRPMATFEGGTLKAAGDFTVKAPGMNISFGTPKRGKAVVLDLNGHNVTLPTGLNGGSDVTVKGAGTFGPSRAGIQGIPTGTWTVESTGAVDLRNAAGFAGGLVLREGANVTLGIGGESMVELLAWHWPGDVYTSVVPQYSNDTLVASHVATTMEFFEAPAQDLPNNWNQKYNNYISYNVIGEFYVSAERVGAWSFNTAGETFFGMMIDSARLSTGGQASIELDEGWHKFMLEVYMNPKNGHKCGATGSNSCMFAYKVGSGDWTPFNMETVPMRMRSDAKAKTTVRRRKYRSYANSVNVYANLDPVYYAAADVVETSLQPFNTKVATGVNATFGGAASRLDGYFYVSAERAGRWNFQGGYDDNIAVDIDGSRLFATAGCGTSSANITLVEGWHQFVIRCGDNSASGNTSGGVGGLLTDSHGNTGVSLQFKVRDGGYEAFDERYVPISLLPGTAQKYELPGLGGVTDVAAGARLTNQLRGAGYCPIRGTLKGAGTLTGPFRFTGAENCWEVSGAGNRAKLRSKVAFADADASTLAGLKSIKAVFDQKPTCAVYPLADALGLTDEAVAALACTVVDAAGEDYSEIVTPAIVDGKLVLKNARPSGLTLILR